MCLGRRKNRHPSNSPSRRSHAHPNRGSPRAFRATPSPQTARAVGAIMAHGKICYVEMPAQDARASADFYFEDFRLDCPHAW